MENIPDPATPSVSTSLYTTANASSLDANSSMTSGLGDSILIIENPSSEDCSFIREENSNATICLDSSTDITNDSVVEVSKASTPIAPYSSNKKLEESIDDGSFSVVIDDGPEEFNPSSEDDSELDLEEEPEEAVDVNELGLEGSSVTLPETVTLLNTPDGGSVYLVGTAHFSKESQEDVAKVIQAVQPHVVLVELCKARVNILQLDEQTILEEAKNINFDKIKSTIQQNGLFHGMMNILLLSMSAHLTKELGMAPGGEFRRAFAEAKKVPHCVVHLGDRPIKLTLQRALASLSWWQTLKLTWHIMSKESISKEEVERCKQRDLLEEMLAQLTGEFPAFSRVFVAERDLYLANSLQLAGLPIPCPSAPLGYIPAKVVGVVGIGHVPGIVQHWGKVDQDAIPAIMEIPPPSLTSRVLKLTMKASLLGLLVWGCVRVLPLPPFSREIARGAENSLKSIKATVQGLFQETNFGKDGIGIRRHGNVDKGEGGEKGKESRDRHETGGKCDEDKGKGSERGDESGRTEDAGNGAGDFGSTSGDGEDGKDGSGRRSKDCQEINEDVGVDEEVEEEEESDGALESLGESFKHASDQSSVKRFDAKREMCEIVDDYEHPISDVFYIPTNVPGPGANIEDFESVFSGCSCSDNLDASCHNNGWNCFCVARSLGLNYDDKGLLLPEKLFGNLPVFECSAVCSCARTCGNRKVQFGPSPSLSVFESIASKGTESSKIIESFPLEESIKESGRTPCVSIKILGKGLGLRTLKHIPKGAFICEYAGEVVGKQEAVRRWKNDCSLGLPNYILALLEWYSPPPPREISDPSTIDTFPLSSCQSKGNDGCTPREIGDIKEDMKSKNCLVTYIDPTRVGNIGRYANHSCDPNATAVAVRIDHPVPCLCLFAAKDLMPGDEVTFDYAGLDKSSNSYCSEILSLMPKVSESERFLMPLGGLGSPILNLVTESDGDASEDASAIEDHTEDFKFKEAKKKCTDLTSSTHSHQTIKNHEVDVSLDCVFKKPKIFVPTQKTSENKSRSPIVTEYKTKHPIEIEKIEKSIEVSHCQPDAEPLLRNENVQINRTPCLCGTKKCRKYLPFSGYWI